jgi:hypothetical protein
MKIRTIIIGFSVLLLTAASNGQVLPESANTAGRACFTGSLHNDFVLQANEMEGFNNAEGSQSVIHKNKYSPLAAGLFSAVVPGTGQIYTKSYWQSAAFFGAEVLTWIIYASYEKKGDQRTNDFQQYANDHWSVARYADWINTMKYVTAKISVNSDQSLKPWERVDWSELNTVEEQIGAIYNSGFTHKLAPYGDQQYYEMIGKYSQFGGGWDDAGGYTTADVIANNGIGNVSPRFSEYSIMRGDANSFYNIATTVSYVIVANHVFSALEAAFNASKINRRIQLQGHIQSRQIYGNLVEFVPTLQMKYEF